MLLELKKIDEGAEEFAAFRSTFAAALEGALARFYDGSNFTSPVALNRFYEEVDRHLMDYLRRISILKTHIEGVALEAFESASDMPFIKAVSYNDFKRSASVDTLSEAYTHRVRESLERDAMNAVAEISLHVKKVSLRVGMMTAQTGYQDRAAMIKVTEQLRKTMDRRGRSVNAQEYVRLTVRDALLTLRNEVFIIAMQLAGLTIGTVKNENPDHKQHGRKFRVFGNGNLSTYEEIRGEVFHPRSRSVVTVKG